MEIEIPFSNIKKDFGFRPEELKYRAILSRDSLFYGLFDLFDKLIYYNSVSVDDVSSSSSLQSRQYNFRHAFIAFNNPIFAFTKSSLNSIEEIKSLLQFSNSISDIDRYRMGCRKNVLGELDVCYAVPKRITKAISGHFKAIDMDHYQSVFLQTIDRSWSPSFAVISLLSGNMNMALFENGKLQLANTYQARNESDFYYYIALMFDQFSLVKGETSILLEGDFSGINLNLEMYFKYFGCEPRFIQQDSFGNETNSALSALTRLNKCASLEVA